MDNRSVSVLVSIICCLFRCGLALLDSTNETCKNEVTYGFRQNFTWNVSTTTGFYVSQPNCFDENGNLIERHCANSVWMPKQVTCYEPLKRTNNGRKRSDNSQAEIETILTFDSRRRKMFLILYHPSNVEEIACYAFYMRKESISFDLLFDSKNATSGYFQKSYRVFELEISDHPTEYWCEISQKFNSTILVTDKVVGHKEDEAYQEFVMKVGWNYSFAGDLFDRYYCRKLEMKCRIMKIVSDANHNKDAFIHVTLYFKSNKVVNGYYKLRNYFERKINLKYILSSDFCLPDKTVTNKELKWNLTPLGEKAKPTQICLNNKGFLATRRCVGDFLHGAYFEYFKDDCAEDLAVPKNTAMLFDILSKHNFTVDVFKNFSSIIKEESDVSVNDIAIFSDGLFETSQIDNYEEIEEDYFDSIDTLNSLDHNVLTSSQASLNATDKILDSLEKFLVRKTEMGLNENRSTVLTQRKNLVIFVTKPLLSNISGIALYRNDSKSFLECTIKELLENDTLQSLPRENLELALHVPTALLELNGNSSLIITIYYNDSLFNEENVTNTANSRVIGVTMPGLGEYLEVPISLLLRPLKTTIETFTGCGYWQYGKASPSRKGKWSTKGGEDVDIDDMIYCSYTHLTHFGLLILSGRLIHEQESTVTVVDSFLSYDEALSIITIIGCSLSLVGISGIFVTACVFRRFREKIGTKILMLLSLPISLEIVLTQIAGLENWHSDSVGCKIIGILLHYVVLLKFSWMFVIALLQYFRFVKVLGPMPQRIFLKANLVCWLIPTVPVALSASLLPGSYTAGVQNFCYPKQWALYFGLFGPASLIIIFNILVFVMIMVSISNSKAVQYDKSGKMMRRQTYLAILLFFMLGIPWVFGILAEILRFGWLEITFVYLFCLTATLQGFVLFVFYVVLDKDTRSLWVTYIKYRKT